MLVPDEEPGRLVRGVAGPASFVPVAGWMSPLASSDLATATKGATYARLGRVLALADMARLLILTVTEPVQGEWAADVSAPAP